LGSFAPLLRDGLGLAFFRRPRRTPLDAGFGSFALLWLIGVAVDAAWQWPLVEAPRLLNGYGVQTSLAAGFLALAAAALLCAVSGRRAIFWTVACWMQAAWLPISAVVGVLYVLAPRSDLPLAWIGWIGGLAWIALTMLRLAAFLAGKSVARAVAAAALALLIQVAPWMVLDAQRLWITHWNDTENFDEFWQEPGTLAEPEATFYRQNDLLDEAVAGLAAQRPDVVDLYLVAFGGDAGENVFRNEVEYIERLFAERFDTKGRTLGLLNHADTAPTRPLATATNLERALQGVAQRMDVEQDLLFLYLTTHGDEEHSLFVNQPPLPLDQLTPQRLRAALDASGIRWRVLVVSACYSGGYIEPLRDERTLVITASRADRSSFGCGADSLITWFGKAFLVDALNATADFVAAYAQAKKSVAEWERDGDFPASEPQISEGGLIGAKLEAWRGGFESGGKVEFAPVIEE
jgi:hypothetical protein